MWGSYCLTSGVTHMQDLKNPDCFSRRLWFILFICLLSWLIHLKMNGGLPPQEDCVGPVFWKLPKRVKIRSVFDTHSVLSVCPLSDLLMRRHPTAPRKGDTNGENEGIKEDWGFMVVQWLSPHSQCRGPGCDPCSGNQISQVPTESSQAANCRSHLLL